MVNIFFISHRTHHHDLYLNYCTVLTISVSCLMSSVQHIHMVFLDVCFRRWCIWAYGT